MEEDDRIGATMRDCRRRRSVARGGGSSIRRAGGITVEMGSLSIIFLVFILCCSVVVDAQNSGKWIVVLCLVEDVEGRIVTTVLPNDIQEKKAFTIRCYAC